MLRIGRSEHEGLAIFSLSGRIEEQQVSELRELLEAEGEGRDLMLDLEEVRLVDREAVRFLAACQARGIKLRNCPSYIQEWMDNREGSSREGSSCETNS
jgi:anti-anti-sigma regulatory factor